MKILRIDHLIIRKPFSTSREYKTIIREIEQAISVVHWPHGSGSFTLNNESEHCNGVKPIKESCMSFLSGLGWALEEQMRIVATDRPGKVDALKELRNERFFAVEWETGNISSSHRALNKLAIGLMNGVLAGGVLIVPSRAMYRWLTDRVGNYAELQPYFPLWRSISLMTDGVHAIIEVEHDSLSAEVPKIGKGTDGRALR
jgi:hypothetical protein